VEDAVTRPGGRGEVQARLDPERARRLGLAPQDMADVFGFTLGGLRLARFNAGDREVEMNLALALEDRENLEDLRQLVATTRNGRPVQLGEIADFQVVARAQSIERENRKIRVQVRAAYEGKDFGPTARRSGDDERARPAPGTWSQTSVCRSIMSRVPPMA
jgi:multidrug efflux pump subunit AcrB